MTAATAPGRGGSGRRVVVYGEYPPAPGPAAEATLEAVRARLAEGFDVEVVSPRPSAAHRHADLATVRGAALLARRAVGADLELTLDPAVLGSGDRLRTPVQTLLALTVAGARHTTVRLGPLRGAAGRGRIRVVLGRAERVEAASEADADALARAGVDRSRIVVRSEPAGAAEDEPSAAGLSADAEPWRLEAAPTREELQAEVRRRAALDREAVAGNAAASTWPLHVLGPMAPATPTSARPAVALVKRAVNSVAAWLVLPIVEHVNHLQQAMIESLDRHAALPDHASDRDVTIS